MLRKIIKVFLASPGDLKVEREAAHRIVNELNRQSAGFWNAQFELVGWEDTVTRFGRAQELINQELDQCELFLGLIWQKWGSPPGGSGHAYTSGFEEEYQRSLNRRAITGSPEMSLLFKAPEDGRLQDPGPELQKVLNFKKIIIDSKNLLFQEFRNQEEFEYRVRSILIEYVQSLLQSERRDDNKVDHPSTAVVNSSSATADHSQEVKGSIPLKAADFLNTVLSKNNRGETITPAEVARLRIIGCAIAREGNDDETLGVHDANIIYDTRDTIELTPIETRSLLRAGIKSLHHENTPVWAWLNAGPHVPDKTLIAMSFGDDATLTKNSIKCLNWCGYSLDVFNAPLDRKGIINIWLNSDSEDVKAEAFDYLSTWGNSNDVELLHRFTEDSNQAVAQKALRAIVKITTRDNLEEALKILIDSSATNIGEDLVSLPLKKPSAIRTEILSPGILSRSPSVRLATMRILCSRSALPENDARALLDDPEPRIRAEALDYLLSKEHSFSVTDVKKILVRKSLSPRPVGLMSLFTGTQTEGLEFLQAYLKKRLARLPVSALREEAKMETGESFIATETLYSRDYKTQFPVISANLKNGFLEEFRRRLAEVRSASTSSDSAASNMESRAEQICESMINATVQVVCEVGGAEALPLIRTILDRGKTEYNERIVEYFEKYGEWEDVKRLAALTSRLSLRISLLYSNNIEEKRVAKAILKVGKHRTADLASLNLSGNLLAYIIAEMPTKSFASLDDRSIIHLLSHESSGLRKFTALKTVLSVSRARLNRVLATYLDRAETRYYNVVFWLDLGTAASAGDAKAIANRVLRRVATVTV